MFVWPVRGVNNCPPGICQSRTVPSAEPEARSCPSEEKATFSTELV